MIGLHVFVFPVAKVIPRITTTPVSVSARFGHGDQFW
jgi:hypothetical protein